MESSRFPLFFVAISCPPSHVPTRHLLTLCISPLSILVFRFLVIPCILRPYLTSDSLFNALHGMSHHTMSSIPSPPHFLYSPIFSIGVVLFILSYLHGANHCHVTLSLLGSPRLSVCYHGSVSHCQGRVHLPL